jgi:glycosyltransferase involved in cell wall biosynthesis
VGLKVFYAAGPGDAIRAHNNWAQDQHDPTEVSVTFSSQVEQFCKDAGASLYIVCHPPQKAFLRDGPTTIEHRPKPLPNGRGPLYHLRELWYGLSLLITAVRFRANVAILDSGCTHFFWQGLFRLFGMKVIPVLHNTLWPSGYRPTKPIQRFVLWLDKYFWRHVPHAVVCVSPECERQVRALAGYTERPFYHTRAQFEPEYFSRVAPPPPHSQRPFRIMFIGRVNRIKGVFDILEMAENLERSVPGRVKWEICGRGPDLNALRSLHAEKGLDGVVDLRGWTSLDDLVYVYGRSHASIVPTRSSFTEGLAMTAAESILANRPVITSPVVPALEVLRPAAVEANTDDVDSYVGQILKLIDDADCYQRMVDACPTLAAPFYDRNNGLTAVLHRILFADTGPSQPTESAAPPAMVRG